MMHHLLVHEISRAYEVNGNMHLVFATAAGNVNTDGSDITEENVVIAIPIPALQKMLADLEALKKPSKDEPILEGPSESVEIAETEILGAPIFTGASRI